jgi:hypothetical protein
MCATGDLTCEARFWSTGSTSASDMTYSCFACEKSATTCANTVVTDSTANDKQCSKYVSTVTGTFKQNTAADTTAATLKITQFKYEPNSKTALGRFYYKPSTTMSLYTGSTIEYTFGG